ncbi:hypothetical protein, partial [Pseudomonas aeruginosa]|uniref:hypothetical protein n=1 Tax=Pseudomonas aeruginosa TaxID=287 RepID=UPI001ABBF913
GATGNPGDYRQSLYRADGIGRTKADFPAKVNGFNCSTDGSTVCALSNPVAALLSLTISA